MASFGSKITLSNYEGWLTGRTFEAVYLDVPLTEDYARINAVIRSRGSQVMLGGTNLGAGMDQAVAVLTAPDIRPLAHKIMIVMTDGQWNAGRDPVECAQDAKNAGIVVHTVTFLPGADQADMKEVAQITGGKHYHADDAESLSEAFRELALTLPVVLIQ
jgi:Mg-chelatase subunit ChlD